MVKLSVKKRPVIISIIAIATIFMVAACFTQIKQNHVEPAENRSELVIPNDTPDEVKDGPRPNAADKASTLQQETDALINEMSDTLSDLEETVNSLDDISDSDLDIPE